MKIRKQSSPIMNINYYSNPSGNDAQVHKKLGSAYEKRRSVSIAHSQKMNNNRSQNNWIEQLDRPSISYNFNTKPIIVYGHNAKQLITDFMQPQVFVHAIHTRPHNQLMASGSACLPSNNNAILSAVNSSGQALVAPSQGHPKQFRQLSHIFSVNLFQYYNKPFKNILGELEDPFKIPLNKEEKFLIDDKDYVQAIITRNIGKLSRDAIARNSGVSKIMAQYTQDFRKYNRNKNENYLQNTIQFQADRSLNLHVDNNSIQPEQSEYKEGDAINYDQIKIKLCPDKKRPQSSNLNCNLNAINLNVYKNSPSKIKPKHKKSLTRDSCFNPNINDNAIFKARHGGKNGRHVRKFQEIVDMGIGLSTQNYQQNYNYAAQDVYENPIVYIGHNNMKKKLPNQGDTEYKHQQHQLNIKQTQSIYKSQKIPSNQSQITRIHSNKPSKILGHNSTSSNGPQYLGKPQSTKFFTPYSTSASLYTFYPQKSIDELQKQRLQNRIQSMNGAPMANVARAQGYKPKSRCWGTSVSNSGKIVQIAYKANTPITISNMSSIRPTSSTKQKQKSRQPHEYSSNCPNVIQGKTGAKGSLFLTMSRYKS